MTTRELKSEICYIDKNSKPFFDMYLNRLLTKVKLKKDSKILLISLGNYKFYKYMKENYKNVIIMDENDNFDGIRNFGIDFKKLEKLNMQFDVAIMNPPYSGNLHLKILEQVIPVAERTVCLHPAHWDEIVFDCYDDYELRIKLRDMIKSKSETFSGESFCISWGDLFITVFDGGTYPKNNLPIFNVIQKMNKIGIELGSIEEPEKDKSRPYFAAVTKELLETHRQNNTVCYSRECKRPGSYAMLNFELPENKVKRFNFVNFKTENERDNFEQMWTNTFLGKFINNLVHDSGAPRCKVLKKFHIPSDYSQPWTDERLYKYFKLTPEEIKIIEDACN